LTSLAECCRCGRSRSKIETPCTAIVKVTNLAARLCGEAKGGQILISAGVATACLPR
jgi:class 3 adenylate cyclase